MNTIVPGMKIGEGGCAEVYEWRPGTLIKIGRSHTRYESIQNEFRNTMIAWNCGLPVPRPYEVVEVGGRPGLVMERIYGESMIERFFKGATELIWEEADDENIRITARLLSDIHSKSGFELQPQRDIMKYHIGNVPYLTLLEKEQIIKHLDGLPKREQLCHGDPNPGNILMQEDRAVVIDWMDASIGNPEADLAEFILMIRYAILPPVLPVEVLQFFDSVREHIIQVFTEEYNRLSPVSMQLLNEWLLPVAARKLTASAISEEEKALLLREIRSRI